MDPDRDAQTPKRIRVRDGQADPGGDGQADPRPGTGKWSDEGAGTGKGLTMTTTTSEAGRCSTALRRRARIQR